MRSFLKRLGGKLASLAPILGISVVLVLILGLAAQLLEPYFPDDLRQVMKELRRGDWAEARTGVKELLGRAPGGAAVGLVGLQTLQVLVAPVPGQVLGLLGGYLFGFWAGVGLNLVGLAIGSTIMIGLGRLFGKGLVRRLVSEKVVKRFDDLVERGGLPNLFLVFLLPALPDDAVCLVAGLTRYPIWKLVAVCVAGRLPGIAVLAWVGASSADGTLSTSTYVIVGVAMLAAVVIWLYSDELQRKVTDRP